MSYWISDSGALRNGRTNGIWKTYGLSPEDVDTVTSIINSGYLFRVFRPLNFIGHHLGPWQSDQFKVVAEGQASVWDTDRFLSLLWHFMGREDKQSDSYYYDESNGYDYLRIYEVCGGYFLRGNEVIALYRGGPVTFFRMSPDLKRVDRVVYHNFDMEKGWGPYEEEKC